MFSFHETFLMQKKKLGAEKSKLQPNWWEKLYEKSSTNIIKSLKKEKKKEEEEMKPIQTNSVSSVMKEVQMSSLYRSFVKASDKTTKHFNKQFSEKSIETSVKQKDEKVENQMVENSSDSEDDKTTIITEDLFKECEGRTLKKYRQVGKHKRLLKQELMAMQRKDETNKEKVPKKEKKKRKREEKEVKKKKKKQKV